MVTSQAETVERLPWSEICARYPDRWVAVADIAWIDSDFSLIEAAVIATFAERKESTPMMKALHAANRRSVGCFWTGTLIGDPDLVWRAPRRP